MVLQNETLIFSQLHTTLFSKYLFSLSSPQPCDGHTIVSTILSIIATAPHGFLPQGWSSKWLHNGTLTQAKHIRIQPILAGAVEHNLSSSFKLNQLQRKEEK